MASKKIGQYEIRSKIGQGGMANVFLGYDTNLEREVAIKVLEAYFAREPAFAARFDREAKTITSLEHSHIVPLYDFGNFKGLPYLVMRYMKGGSLGKRLEKGPLTLKQASTIIRRVASALDYAHENAIIHRDLKPDNILFDLEENAFLADFGIVKIAESSTTYTQTGNTLGTPAYMSPEQAIAQKEIDSRSDIYSLGVIIYEMLTGDVPYKADTNLGQAMMHVMEPVPRILQVMPDLPDTIETIIQKAMAKDRAERYAKASDLADALEQAAQADVASFPTVMSEPIEAVAPETAEFAEPADSNKNISTLPNESWSAITSEEALAPNVASANPSAPDSSAEPPAFENQTTHLTTISAAEQTPGAFNRDEKSTLAAETNEGPKRPFINLWSLMAMGILLATIVAVILWQNNGQASDSLSLTSTAEAIALVQTAVAATQTHQQQEENKIPTASTATASPTASPTPAPTRTPTALPNFALGSTLSRSSDGMEMVYVPAGSFLMGSDLNTDPDGGTDEMPAHEVILDSFWIDKSEVTNAQFSRFVSATSYRTTAEREGFGTIFTGSNFSDVNGADWQHPVGPNSSLEGLNNHPVVMVSWSDAAAYCQWAGGQLPSEAQWEYAARGPNGFLFPWGNEWPSCTQAKFADCSGRTFSVGSFSPAGDSWVGATDLAGNVWEWVTDWYDENYYANSPLRNPTGASSSDKKIHKGGSWGSNPVLLRSAFRGDNEPDKRFDLIGFRCVVPDD